ncbi:MAG: cell division protein ZapB [Spirochaetes bacterium]|nr:cell division protein ZapB [Spirochaetota bacterium]
MVSLEQIRKLEARVSQAVSTILELREENTTLRQKLEKYQEKIDQLELLIAQYRDSQKEIEEGILNALRQLDHLEDDALRASSSTPSSIPQEPFSEHDEAEDIEGKIVIPDKTNTEEAKEVKKSGELDIF